MQTDQARREAYDLLTQELHSTRSISLFVNSSSMAPTLRLGQMVTIEPIPPSGLLPDDVVLTRRDDTWVLHRLIDLRLDSGKVFAITRGDAAQVFDVPIPVTDILGRVSGSQAGFPPGLSPDGRLLLASFPHSTQTSGPTFFSRLTSCDDQVVATATIEGLAPLIYYSNRELLVQEQATLFARRTQDSYIETLARSTLFLAQADRAKKILGAIPVILLKGADLALHLYESPALRPFSDIDILIKPSDFIATSEKLSDAGYCQTSGPSSPRKGQSINSAMFRSSDSPAALHIHWALDNASLCLYNGPTYDSSAIWAATRRHPDGWLTLSPEHTLIHLCEHAVKHSFDRLIQLRDIAELIRLRSGSLDWERVVADAHTFHLADIVAIPLRYIQRHIAIAPPIGIIERLLPEPWPWPHRAFLRMASQGIRSQESALVVYLFRPPSWTARLRLLRRSLFPPRDLMNEAFLVGEKSQRAGPGVYVARLGRGLGHVVRTVGSVLRNSTRR